MCKDGRTTFVPGLILAMILANTGVLLFSAQTDLNQRLMEIERRAGAPAANLNKLEAEALSLIQQYRSPEELGKIYTGVAQLYRNSIKPGNMQSNLKKIRAYSAKALEYPLNPHDHVRAYLNMGSAIWGLVSDTNGDWPHYRREIAISFLKGLKVLLDSRVPAEPVDLPGIGKYDCDDPHNDPECKAMREEHDRQERAWERAQEINKLQLLRATLIDNIVGVYSVNGQAIEELREIASQILKNDAVVSSLIAKVADCSIRFPHVPICVNGTGR